jgi:hypothetical protein
VNVFPALVSVTLSGNTVNVTPVLYGNHSATDIPSGTSVTLNLTDPDSLTADLRGNIVLDSQADTELVFITPGGAVGRLIIPSSPPLSLTVDDTAFAPRGPGFLACFGSARRGRLSDRQTYIRVRARSGIFRLR